MPFIWHRKNINTLYKADCEKTVLLSFAGCITLARSVLETYFHSDVVFSVSFMFQLKYKKWRIAPFLYLSEYQVLVMWVNLCVAGKGREGGAVVPSGTQGGEVPLLEKLLLIAAAFVVTFSFPFLWWPFVVQGADGILISPHSGWGLKGGGVFPPLMWKNRFLDYSTLMLWESRLQMTSKTLFLSFHTKTIGIASSWLSQRTGVYYSGHLLQIWGRWSKWTWGIGWGCWRSLFPNM